MSFRFGRRSKANLKGVTPELVRLCEHALSVTLVDFTVVEGLRTMARQEELVAAGASTTLNSKHLTGHAVDLYPYVGGVRMEYVLQLRVAAAMSRAAYERGEFLRWGGCWRTINRDPLTPAMLDDLVQQYAARRRAQRRRVFIDAWHFEVRGNT